MAGQKAAQMLDAKDLANVKLVFDLVYNPIETPLIRLARQQGIPFITGVEMFVQQGARQFEIWTGKPAPEEEMLRVVIHSLRQQAEAAGVQSQPESEAKAVAKPAGKPVPAKASIKAAPVPAKAKKKA
jgi:3-dehydroquinate dehydratase/shikimate dehydrogenase